jgi:hypothetical protein
MFSVRIRRRRISFRSLSLFYFSTNDSLAFFLLFLTVLSHGSAILPLLKLLHTVLSSKTITFHFYTFTQCFKFLKKFMKGYICVSSCTLLLLLSNPETGEPCTMAMFDLVLTTGAWGALVEQCASI